MRLLASSLLLLLVSVLASAPAPVTKPAGAVVLDDCDRKFDGKADYEDNLSFISPAGKLEKRVSGLNICQEIGCPHRIAIDHTRKFVWVAETVGARLLKYSLDGKLVFSVPKVKGNAIAIDPTTGNAWVACLRDGGGEDTTFIYGPEGRLISTLKVGGYDITYDSRGKAFWVAGKGLTKLSPAGKVLLQKPNVAAWLLISVVACPKTGHIWASERQSSPRNGKDRLLIFDADGKELSSISMVIRPALRLAVNPGDGSVWVARGPNIKLTRYSAEGRRLDDLPFEALSVDADPTTGGAWVVTREEALRVTRDGKVLTRIKHKEKTLQAWVASY
jgi:hypothetical protein